MLVYGWKCRGIKSLSALDVWEVLKTKWEVNLGSSLKPCSCLVLYVLRSYKIIGK